MTSLRFGLLILSLGACAPDLEALSVAPPGRAARIDNQNDTIELSHGVALAFECGACDSPTVVVGDRAVAEVRRAYIGETVDSYGAAPSGRSDRIGYVLLGISPGTTTLEVKEAGAPNPSYRVTVLDD